MNREDDIRAAAHALWLAEGCPEGREHEHWRRASEQVDKGATGPAADTKGRDDMPGSGPHARAELTNADATPGTGMLPEIGSDDPNQQPSG